MFRGIKILFILTVMVGLHSGLFAKTDFQNAMLSIAGAGNQSPDYGSFAKCGKDNAGDYGALTSCAVSLQLAEKNRLAGQDLFRQTLLGIAGVGGNGNGNGNNNNGNGSGGERAFSLECRTSPNTTLQFGMAVQGIASALNTFANVYSTYWSANVQKAYIADNFATTRAISKNNLQAAITGNGNYISPLADASTAPWYVIKPDQAGVAMAAQYGYSPYSMYGGYGGYGSGYGGLYGTNSYGLNGSTGSYLINPQQASSALANRGSGGTTSSTYLSTTTGTTGTGTARGN